MTSASLPECDNGQRPHRGDAGDAVQYRQMVVHREVAALLVVRALSADEREAARLRRRAQQRRRIADRMLRHLQEHTSPAQPGG